MAFYFTSDHHIGHGAARTFYRRPFASVGEMDQVLFDRWNAVVENREMKFGIWAISQFDNQQSV